MSFSLLQALIYFAANLLQGTLSLSPNSTYINPVPGDCFKSGDHYICLPKNYSKYDLPSFKESVLVTIEVHIKDIPKVDILLEYCQKSEHFYFRFLTKTFLSPWILTLMLNGEMVAFYPLCSTRTEKILEKTSA
jgi:hypothetical protein